MEDTVEVQALWSSSYGLTSNQQIPLFFSAAPLANGKQASVNRIRRGVKPASQDLVIGWGSKPNTLAAQAFARKHALSYLCLEDGFIGYLGHSSSDKKRLSLIKDDVGIYYDARKPSRLEQLCHSPCSLTDEARAQQLIASISQQGISKYNHSRKALPKWLSAFADDCILLVDQTAGDQSITAGLADAESFQHMLEAALAAHPNKPILIKTHPDVLIAANKTGNQAALKRGHYQLDALAENVHLLVDDCLIPELMNKVTDVYVVTSQLGFEALLYGKKVHCFGMPFYAGWGLTEDRLSLERRNRTLSLAQLVYFSLIKYPSYLHPETQKPCEAEVIVEWLALQLDGQGVERTAVNICYAFGFSLWKRAFVRQFVARLADSVVFINNEKKLLSLLANKQALDKGKADQHYSVLLWGRGRKDWAQTLRQYSDVWFMEDGFLRSVGLGADLRRPSCLVIDRQGMYYDSSEKSDIIDILNTIDLSAEQQQRAERLVATIKRLAITKYNVGRCENSADLSTRLQADAAGREIIVVPGQFENDLSIACSLGSIKKNIDLLAQVKADYPEAFIIFKEHPDVYSGVRPGALGAQAASQYADLYLADIDMASLLDCADRVCTLTSLTGFEALLRNKKVTVYGSPFYAGWGLSCDKLALPGREQTLSLAELVYGTMVKYSRYIDWHSGRLTGPEQTAAFLAQQREVLSGENLNSSWLSRQGRKLKYFIESFFF